MPHRATCVSKDPIDYFLGKNKKRRRYLRVSDVILRENHDPKEVFAQIIRFATNSRWSHCALVYLLSDPTKGFNNTFLIEARTRGIRINSLRNEVLPYEQFTVGIKRLRLDWYVEMPYEKTRHDPRDPEDTYGIDYLRHVRGIALDQINGLFDLAVVDELVALYVERVAKRYLKAIPQVAEVADSLATLFKQWAESENSKADVVRFICSGLVQYSFFAALRIRIINGLADPESREAAISNLGNLHRIVFREDPEGVISRYIHQIQAGELKVDAPVPNDVLDLLKTAMPADFNNSPNLEWRYVIRKGWIWQIDEATGDYKPQSDDEAAVLDLMVSELPGQKEAPV